MKASGGSQGRLSFFGDIVYFHPELEPLESRQHSAEFVPWDFFSVNDQERPAIGILKIVIDSRPDDIRFCDLQAASIGFDMALHETAPSFVKQLIIKLEGVAFGIVTEDFEFVSTVLAILDFQGGDDDSVAQAAY